MKILVTGGAGFIGRNVVERLRSDGHEVTVSDVLEPRVHGSGPVEPTMLADHFIQGLGSSICLSDLMAIEVVVHLAAQVGVADSMEDPMRYIQNNVNDTAILFENLRRAKKLGGKLKRLVTASSMSIYGEGGSCVNENDSWVNPQSVYALTKYDQERLTHMYGDLLGIDATTLRFWNVYGPGQALSNPYTGVLAIFANRILNGKRPIVFDDGQQTRDFIFVDDVTRAVTQVATMTSPPRDAFNICTGRATTIKKAAEQLARSLGRPDLQPVITYKLRRGDVYHCVGDPYYTNRVLGFRAEVSFECGISRYAGWLLKENGTCVHARKPSLTEPFQVCDDARVSAMEAASRGRSISHSPVTTTHKASSKTATSDNSGLHGLP